MGMKIDKTDMIRLMPAWMGDDEADRSLASSMDQLFSAIGKRVKTPRVWDQLEQMTDEELDETAWELGIDWYNSSWDRIQKIATIKVAGTVIKKRGTKWAVEQLVQAAFGYGKISEWFEYGGEPFYFKIVTSALLTQDGMKTFLGMIGKVKNVRSHLEKIEILRIINQDVVMGLVHYSIYKPPAIVSASKLNKTIEGISYQGMQGIKVMRPAAIMEMQQSNDNFSESQ